MLSRDNFVSIVMWALSETLVLNYHSGCSFDIVSRVCCCQCYRTEKKEEKCAKKKKKLIQNRIISMWWLLSTVYFLGCGKKTILRRSQYTYTLDWFNFTFLNHMITQLDNMKRRYKIGCLTYSNMVFFISTQISISRVQPTNQPANQRPIKVFAWNTKPRPTHSHRLRNCNPKSMRRGESEWKKKRRKHKIKPKNKN